MPNDFRQSCLTNASDGNNSQVRHCCKFACHKKVTFKELEQQGRGKKVEELIRKFQQETATCSSQAWYPALRRSDSAGKQDFLIYRGNNVDVLFCDKVPKDVAEACLLNDEFILVKIPDESMRKRFPPLKDEEVGVHAEDATDTIRGQPILEQQVFQGTATIVKYLRSNQTRKVAPIPDSTEVKSKKPEQDAGDIIQKTASTAKDDNLKTKAKKLVQRCWKVEETVETFTTQTEVQGKYLNALVSSNKSESAKSEALQQPLDLSMAKEEAVPADVAKVTKEVPESSELSRSVRNLREIFTTKRDLEVELEPQGQLIVNDNSGASTSVNAKPIQPHKHKLGPHSMAFQWFRNPFHGRPKTKKPKKKINAVVQKTYFVRWVMPLTETIWHGFGVKRVGQSDEFAEPIVRRCRSAVF